MVGRVAVVVAAFGAVGREDNRSRVWCPVRRRPSFGRVFVGRLVAAGRVGGWLGVGVAAGAVGDRGTGSLGSAGGVPSGRERGPAEIAVESCNTR